MDKDLIKDLEAAAASCDAGSLTTWEIDFIKSISTREFLSDKQRAIAVELTDKIERFSE